VTAENRISYNNPKRLFDATSGTDLREYQYFLQQGRWQTTCPFVCESPWESVIFMIERRIAEVWINDIILETEA
jgi:hypothetical protein